MWPLLYRLLLWLAYPVVRLRLVLRARREPAYAERIPERFGHAPADIPRGCVWFHTVSAGETIAAAPLIAELVRAWPQLPFLVTTMTPAGSAEVHARLGGRVHHCYAPYDFPRGVRRFFDRLEPRVLILMETELWPNLIATAAARGVPVVLVNARLSARSARGYARVAGLTRRMLATIDRLACQFPEHVERFCALGAPADRVVALGSVKFDARLPADHAARVAALEARWRFADQPVWIAGSTHPGEEERILAAHRAVRASHPGARLILVPRHPVRAEEVHARCRAAGFTVGRHAIADPADASADVVLVDAMGVLLDYYGRAGVAFVGGSLVDQGGHNPIEPALLGVPVVMGPNVFNFADVVERFRAAGCLRLVADADDLAGAIRAWFDDPEGRRATGLRARAVVAANAGASVRLRALLDGVLARAGTGGAGDDNRQAMG
ncbi:MAG: lipid IV(A) 3-deoxy-D-manno-octulosonic acid transferase [Pseudomonadales bacterium]|nr:lipid IV(A) 3-deoxy-D-manno-octulosonic acid transferase [Pseudomonadales bacterium]